MGQTVLVATQQERECRTTSLLLSFVLVVLKSFHCDHFPIIRRIAVWKPKATAVLFIDLVKLLASFDRSTQALARVVVEHGVPTDVGLLGL